MRDLRLVHEARHEGVPVSGREISPEQFAELETEHGPGCVIRLEIGADEFAFRRYDRARCVDMLRRRDEGCRDWLEFAARQAILCPEAPRAGKGVAAAKLLAPDERAAMAAERARLDAALNAAPALGDALGSILAEQVGRNARTEPTAQPDGSYEIVVTMDPDIEPEPFAITIRKLSRTEYSARYRDRIGQIEESALLLGTEKEPGVFGMVCIDPRRAEIAERYPLLAYELARDALLLGLENAAVRVKKFPATTTPTPGSSPSEPQTT